MYALSALFVVFLCSNTAALIKIPHRNVPVPEAQDRCLRDYHELSSLSVNSSRKKQLYEL